jgi:putative ABC transport system substrate-binding protein
MRLTQGDDHVVQRCRADHDAHPEPARYAARHRRAAADQSVPIGRLVAGSSHSDSHLLEAFRQGLRDLGYVEGQNLVIEYRYAEGSQERLPDLAAELVRLQVEVIVAGGSNTIRAAQHATRTIPIVMAGTGDAVAFGFVASLARPGGNITGLSDMGAELP